MVKLLLRLEGLTIFLLSLALYRALGFGWTTLVIFILAPDLSMLGYLKNKSFGAFLYNIFHNYSVSILLAGIGFMTGNKVLIAAGIIITMHIGIDRLLGFGLKYPSGFKDTHLQKV